MRSHSTNSRGETRLLQRLVVVPAPFSQLMSLIYWLRHGDGAIHNLMAKAKRMNKCLKLILGDVKEVSVERVQHRVLHRLTHTLKHPEQ